MLAFAVGGTWVTAIAFMTARKGGKLGGFMIGIPSTAGLAFFFTGWFVSSATAVSVTEDFPLFMSITSIFLLCFSYLARRSFSVGLGGALVIWLAVSLTIVESGLDDFGVSLLGSLGVAVVVYCVFRFKSKPKKPLGGSASKYTAVPILLRFLLGGGIVALAVFFGQIGIPVLSALAAAFPALTISALIAVRMNSKTEGAEDARGLTMSAMVSLMTMLIPFSAAVHYLYPMVGVFYGTLASYLTVAAIGLLYYYRAEEYLVPSFA